MAALAFGALQVVLVGGIFAQLAVLSDANDRIHAQDAKLGDLRRESEPVLDALRPLVAETRPLIREARALAGPFGRTADELSAAAEEAPGVGRAVRTVIGESVPVVAMLRQLLPDAAALVPELRALLPELRRALPRVTRFMDEVARRSLLRRADAAVSATLRLESLQTQSLRTIRRQFGIQRQTLAIQREALKHIRSLDRKTGGSVGSGR